MFQLAKAILQVGRAAGLVALLDSPLACTQYVGGIAGTPVCSAISCSHTYHCGISLAGCCTDAAAGAADWSMEQAEPTRMHSSCTVMNTVLGSLAA